MRGRRRLHLLEVSLRWPPETFLQWKLAALVRRGLRITVVSPASKHDPSFRLPGVRVVRVPDWGGTTGALLGGALRDAIALVALRPWRVPRLGAALKPSLYPWRGWTHSLSVLRSYLPLARLRPDVVHFEWNPDAVHYLPLAPVWGCSVVTSCHGGGVTVDPHTPGNGRFLEGLPESFRVADAVHCVSDATVAEARRYGLDPGKVRLIRSAVDPAFFSPPAHGRRGGDELRIVAISWLRWLKGYEYALVAIRRLVDRGVPVRFHVLGGDPDGPMDESPEVRRIRWELEDLGLADRVTLEGHVSSDAIRDRLHRSDVLLHASVTEGIPTVILEAMASGLPVVVTDSGGTREAVTDGREGLVVPPRDTARMADALQLLWERPDLRAAMGRAGRRRVEAEFSLDDQVRSFAEMYETLVGGGRA